MTQRQLPFLAGAFLLAATGMAHAHASLETDTASSESSFKVVVQIPHGCDGKPTTEVQVKLPEGFVFAKPQPKAGWELEVIKGDYQKTYDNHGKPVSAGPLEIRWKGGDLSDEYYDTFLISGRISGFDRQTTIAFPVTQLCGADGKVVWDQIPADGQSAHALEHPAPSLTVMPTNAGSAHHDHMAGMTGAAMAEMAAMPVGDGQAVTAGDLEISGGSVKAMLPGAKVGGGGFVVRNDGAEADRLISVESPAAGHVELHEMTMENDVMKMRKLDDGIAIPAGETVELTSGGLHLMFMDVAKPFAEGDAVPVTLTFEKAGKVVYVLPVGGVAGGGHKHH
ncbi:DUF1775 domain-containing protein [Pararhizobium antarcticum]|uniref:YncI copper-binding domain-containing protein n=1 Tax=Pararhizobium antarcticum TaxID=1798805 RepID=A0A657LPV3_9HYPH|nr:DUF1775 domain-containing protein [Pararhizobium antarcticum]OJF93329.1 hypothetical protein AX760_04780 [Pararhizobium antarcticum]OJF93847.1 hypothetical protein AX761_19550 [Rhizobium sp. 58]